MAKAAFTWKGVWDEGAGGFQEFFGGEDGLPARDLTSDDVAGFSDEQRAKLDSPAGRRLYDGKRADDGKPETKPAEQPDKPGGSVSDPGLQQSPG